MEIKTNGIPYWFTEKELDSIIKLIEWSRERKDSHKIITIVAKALNRNAFNAIGLKSNKRNKI